MPAEPADSDQSKPKISKTGETATIAGYKCTKYTVAYADAKSVQYIWAANDIKIPASAFKNGLGGAKGGSLFMEGIEGVPLKMTMTESGTTSEMLATQVTKATLNAADLQVPSGYTIEPFSSAALTKMMMGGMKK